MAAAAAPIVAAAAPAVIQGVTGALGGSKGSSQNVSPYAALAASIAQRIEKEVDPLRAQFLHMLLQVVTQGGSAAGTPLANQATAASLSSGAQSQQGAATDLARNTGGMANPVAAAILAALKQQNSMGTAAIPTQIGEMLLGQTPGAISSAQNGVSQMLGEAIGGNMTTTGTTINPQFGFSRTSGPSTAFTGTGSTNSPAFQ